MSLSGSASTLRQRRGKYLLRADAILTPGTPLELTRVEGIHDKSGFVEVEATILR